MCAVHGADGLEEPPGPPHCPHIGGINLASPRLLGRGAPAAATCSRSVRSYPPAPGVTAALGCAGSILTPQPSGDAGSPCTSARGGEKAWGYSHVCSPRRPGPRPGCHHVTRCSGTCLAHPPASTTMVVVVLPHKPVCVLDMRLASVHTAETIRGVCLVACPAVTDGCNSPATSQGMPASLPAACSCPAAAGRAGVGRRAVPARAAWQEERMQGWCFRRG